MKLGVLFSGGKDSTYAAYLARTEGYKVACLISIQSKDPHSFMFHTPSISQVEKQAEVMGVPIVIKSTKGEKEIELSDLKQAIEEAIKTHNIEGIVTGAVQSVYQATRIQKICNELNIECFNPLWQKDQLELLGDLIDARFKVIITGIAAHPLDETWLGKEIDQGFIKRIAKLGKDFNINPAGEGGEFESLVLDCPLSQGRSLSPRRKLLVKATPAV